MLCSTMQRAGAPCTKRNTAANSSKPSASAGAPAVSRRGVLRGLVAVGVPLAGAVQPAQARIEPISKEVDAATSPYIQELLKRSRENKEQYDKERLQDYYKRNFKDYFEFEGGDARTGGARGIRSDTQQAIQQWLEKNK